MLVFLYIKVFQSQNKISSKNKDVIKSLEVKKQKILHTKKKKT